MYAGQDAEDALKALNVAPDFDHTKPESDTRILFVQRKLDGSDIYFLGMREEQAPIFEIEHWLTEVTIMRARSHDV